MFKDALKIAMVTAVMMFALNYAASMNATLHSAIKGS
jgi:hypothetical protein